MSLWELDRYHMRQCTQTGFFNKLSMPNGEAMDAALFKLTVRNGAPIPPTHPSIRFGWWLSGY